jgi:hypothetical protein
MSPLVKLALLGAVAYAAWDIHQHGLDGAFGGALASHELEMPGAEGLSNASNVLGDREGATTRESYPARTLDSARDRATAAVRRGAQRSGAE